MNNDELQLEVVRLKTQVTELRRRLTDVEMVADRLTMRVNHYEQDNLPTMPMNEIPMEVEE